MNKWYKTFDHALIWWLSSWLQNQVFWKSYFSFSLPPLRFLSLICFTIISTTFGFMVLRWEFLVRYKRRMVEMSNYDTAIENLFPKYFTKFQMFCLFYWLQWQNPVKYLRWSILYKETTAKTRQLSLQNAYLRYYPGLWICLWTLNKYFHFRSSALPPRARLS